MGKICGFSLLFATVNHAFVMVLGEMKHMEKKKENIQSHNKIGFGLVCYLFIYFYF